MNNMQHVYSDSADEFDDDCNEFEFEPVAQSACAVTPRERYAIAAPASPQPVYTPPPLPSAAKSAKPLTPIQQRQKREEEEYIDAADCGLLTSDLEETSGKERKQLIGGLVTMDPMLVAGPGGSGKTTTWVTAALAMGNCTDYIGPVTDFHTGLMWACEDTKEELSRTANAAIKHLGIDNPQFVFENVRLCARRGHDSILAAKVNGRMQTTVVYEELKRSLRSDPLDFLILDNLAYTFGGNYDDRLDLTFFVRAMLGIQIKPYALILLGHPSRGEGSEYGGSIALDFAVRRRYYQGPTPPGSDIKPQEGVSYLCLRKSNYSPKGEPIRLEYRDGVFVPDPVVKNSSGIVITRAEQALQFTANCICDFLQKGERIRNEPRSPDYLPSKLADDGKLAGFSKQEIAVALRSLGAAKKLIEVECGQAANRTKQFTLGISP